jgi:cell division septum initiation protein DivIVA
VKICQNIVWAVLKAHDVMAEYKRLSFKNHPSVATELVKFLAINTSFESIEKLVAQTKVLETEVSELKKQVTASVKSSASSANKADEARKQSDALVKRVAKLEAK